MDYFQLSVKENTRMLMFTASEPKRKKKIRKSIITTTTTPKMAAMITNRSFKTFFTLHFTGSASNGKFIV